MIRKGLWSPDEDEKLRRSISKYVNGSWNDIARKAGLQRCGRSCRQRWLNHLRPGLRKDKFSPPELQQVIHLQSKLGNRWSEIAAQMKGRTDNEVKNLWNTVIKRRRLHGKLGAGKAPSELHAGGAAEEDDLHALDSPSHTACTSQSASSSHSTWSLHVSPSSPALHHDGSTQAAASVHVNFMQDELYPEQLLMINGADLSHVGEHPLIMNGQDCLHVEQHAAARQLANSLSCLMHPGSPITFESTSLPAHDDDDIMPAALSPCLHPDWQSAPINTYNVIESGSHVPSTTYSFTPPTNQTSPNTSIFENTTLTLPPKTTQNALLSKTIQTPLVSNNIGNGHNNYLRSLQQQCMSIMNHEGSQALLAPSPHLINITTNHEDRSTYALYSGTNSHAYDEYSCSPTSSFLQSLSFNDHLHRSEYGTMASLLWNGGCQ